uniref:PfkB family carbohydrate kinase n=1 Tax=Pseudoclavibacter helvolus TaxID=255205 RepID=UPI0024AE4B23
MSSIEQRETRITVTGESLVDVVVDERGHQTRKPGGSPLNVAVGLGRLGHAVELRTSYGDDTDGALIRAHLDSSLVRVDRAHAESTSTAMARIAPDGSASYEFAVTWDLPASPLPVTSRILHAGSIAAALEPGRKAVVAAMRGGRERGVVTFDPNVRPAFMGPRDEQRAYTEQLFAFSDLVKLSDEDADWLYPSWSLDAVSERILDLGASLAVITRGAAGTHLTSRWALVAAPPHPPPPTRVG